MKYGAILAILLIVFSAIVIADENPTIAPTKSESCEDFTYSSCPSYCEKKCLPSVCSSDGVCTDDCDGKGSCFAIQRPCAMCENGKDTGKKDEYGCPIYDCPTVACPVPSCKENQISVIVAKDSTNGCPIYTCQESPCKTFVDERNCKITTCEDGTHKEYCPDQTCQSYTDIEGCTITKCKDTSSRSCPTKPICKSYVNEQGCTVTVCMDGKESVSCENAGTYAKLGEEFKLQKDQSVKITDYNYLKLTLHEIIPAMCVDRINGGECYNMRVVLTAEMQGQCEIEGNTATKKPASCSSTATKMELEQGKSAEAFGAQITLLDVSQERAVFVVKNPEASEEGVDIEINPSEQSIIYGEKAVYKITVTDKHHPIVCIKAPCNQPLYAYFIDVQNLPFQKEYPKQIEIAAGESESVELVIAPYQVMAQGEGVSSSGSEGTTVSTEPMVVATGRVVLGSEDSYTIAKPVKTERTAEETSTSQTEVKEMDSSSFTKFYRSYKFNVRVMQKENPKNQNIAYAALYIKPDVPPEPVPLPPDFPGESIELKLNKGWNLMSLPGKLVKFEKFATSAKPVAFVFLKEEQRYVSLQEAQEILGEKLQEYLARNAFWIYAPEEISLKARIDRTVSYNELEVKKGWNLLPITEDMIGGFFTDIKGDCQFEKLFIWDSVSQSWKKITEDYVFSSGQKNIGFIVKANEDCHLGGAVIALTPPAMPE